MANEVQNLLKDAAEKTWTRTGFKDLKHINQKISKHENSARHMICSTELALLGTASIAAQLDSAYRQNIIKHNEQVDKNRYLLKRIINCIKFCGKLELALRGHDESEDSENRGIFRELINFTSELDTILKEHLKSATLFKGTSKTVQNEILDSMLEVCQQEIRQQINAAEFLAIQCDETTDISHHCQMVMIFRYLHEGEIQERFWRFLSVTDKTAEGLAKCIEEELGPLLKDSPHKLIAQTYDGANVMSGSSGGVQTKIKQKYQNAHFIHCYAHQLNLIMQRAASQNPKILTYLRRPMELIRDTTEDIQQTVENEHGDNGNKRRKVAPEERNCIISKEVCDIIIVQTKERLSYRGHLEAASLLDTQNFTNYSRYFPAKILNSVVTYYPMVNKEKLKTELEVMYMREDFKNITGGLNLLSLLTNNNLEETFSEVTKLLQIIITTPMSTSEAERCFSTLKRIKSFLRNSMGNERLNALAMMSVNKNLVHNISNFDEKVMEHFISQKDRRLDFTYKH
ncbi:unnamed protein product [Acanthoscelides obtectus]|uniref:Zinc finger MYM-type protein 1-like n=1 Tax=Acanthoscelides obtectus TaxID=200917 RepID=A0A9P0PPF5_ACAOB|nr:unnamed protein product [Acanthoscelides obtectus]CAK1624659.1 Zinc finger MYM-type protein 1 [Acanthoscelides obtectus]